MNLPKDITVIASSSVLIWWTNALYRTNKEEVRLRAWGKQFTATILGAWIGSASAGLITLLVLGGASTGREAQHATLGFGAGILEAAPDARRAALAETSYEDPEPDVLSERALGLVDDKTPFVTFSDPTGDTASLIQQDLINAEEDIYANQFPTSATDPIRDTGNPFISAD